jgi:hypothetical protein
VRLVLDVWAQGPGSALVRDQIGPRGPQKGSHRLRLSDQ